MAKRRMKQNKKKRKNKIIGDIIVGALAVVALLIIMFLPLWWLSIVIMYAIHSIFGVVISRVNAMIISVLLFVVAAIIILPLMGDSFGR